MTKDRAQQRKGQGHSSYGRLPEAFVQRMRHQLEDEAEPFLAALRQERVYGLRINPLKTEPEEWFTRCPFPLEPVPWCPTGFYYSPESRPGKHPYHAAGLYYIQEPSAMAAVEMLDVQPGETVLDLSAAPGGKATQIGAALRGEGLLVANEIQPSRASILVENIERFGIRNAVVTVERPDRLAEHFPAFFDKILVDAPCSGEGMFRKDPQMMLVWSLDNVRRFAKSQDNILDAAATMLKPGGTLVYSTCTFSPEENEGTVARFLVRHPDFQLVRHPLAVRFDPGRPQWGDGRPQLSNCVRIWPHRVRGEGHFVAVMVKAADATDAKASSDSRRGQARAGTSRSAAGKLLRKTASDSQWRDAWSRWTAFAQQFLQGAAEKVVPLASVAPERLIIRHEQLFLLPEAVEESVRQRLAGLRVLRPGLHLGTLKKDRLEPAHALAMTLPAEAVVQTVELSLDADGPQAAVRYLRGESFPLSEEAGRAGWVLVTVDGFPLGWGKASGGQLKNHYPKGLRLL